MKNPRSNKQMREIKMTELKVPAVVVAGDVTVDWL
jgi:hypothetical protein